MKRFGRRLVMPVLLLLGLLHGCASTTTQPPPQGLAFPDTHLYGARPDIPDAAAILALTPEQKSAFLYYFNDPYYASIPAHQRVYSYLEGITAGFNFRGDTLNAAEAFASNGGNCLSLALMTTALAELAGVRIGYQLLDDLPVYQLQGTVVEKGTHVRSILFDPRISAVRDPFQYAYSGLKVDYFPTGNERFVANLTHEAFLAMYYRNIAGSAIAEGDHSRAYWYLRESLAYDANNAEAINMLAVVSRRSGDPARAEDLYRYGLTHAEQKLTLLKNYRVLLLSQQRLAEAQAVERQLEGMVDPSPYHWFQLARAAFQDGEYRDAIRYYRRALTLAPYMHEAHLGMAMAEYELGDSNRAVASLQKALENVYGQRTRQLYKAKLYTIMGQGI